MQVYTVDMIFKSKTSNQHLLDMEKAFKTLRRLGMKLNPKKCVFEVVVVQFLELKINKRGIEANLKRKVVLDMSSTKTVKESKN